MQWYDLIAPIYDAVIKPTYKPYRVEAVGKLELAPGLTVLDLGCGSGLNFELIMDAIGPEGALVGVDFSSGMLARASNKVSQNRWRNVHLVN